MPPRKTSKKGDSSGVGSGSDPNPPRKSPRKKTTTKKKSSDDYDPNPPRKPTKKGNTTPRENGKATTPRGGTKKGTKKATTPRGGGKNAEAQAALERMDRARERLRKYREERSTEMHSAAHKRRHWRSKGKRAVARKDAWSSGREGDSAQAHRRKSMRKSMSERSTDTGSVRRGTAPTRRKRSKPKASKKPTTGAAPATGGSGRRRRTKQPEPTKEPAKKGGKKGSTKGKKGSKKKGGKKGSKKGSKKKGGKKGSSKKKGGKKEGKNTDFASFKKAPPPQDYASFEEPESEPVVNDFSPFQGRNKSTGKRSYLGPQPGRRQPYVPPLRNGNDRARVAAENEARRRGDRKKGDKSYEYESSYSYYEYYEYYDPYSSYEEERDERRRIMEDELDRLYEEFDRLATAVTHALKSSDTLANVYNDEIEALEDRISQAINRLSAHSRNRTRARSRQSPRLRSYRR